MSSYATRRLTALAAAGIVGVTLAYAPVSQAFNFGDMMNPGKWMGGGNRYDDYYDDIGPYGPYGGGPWGGGPRGGPYGGPFGGGPWGPGGYGPYGGPGYGAPGYYVAPGYRSAPAAPAAPSTSSSSASSENVKSAEIEALKRRIEELETRQEAPAPSYTAPPPSTWGSTSTPSSSGSDWGSAPAFRPLNKY